MTARLTVTLRCDHARSHDCHGIYQMGAGDGLLASIDTARERAALQGWRTATTGSGRTEDVCPSCWRSLVREYGDERQRRGAGVTGEAPG